jgi:hypothetical protein
MPNGCAGFIIGNPLLRDILHADPFLLRFNPIEEDYF